MIPAQKQAALETAAAAIARLLDNAPAYGEIGITLTIHANEVRRISETCTRTTQGGAA